MVSDVIQTTKNNLKENKIFNLKNVYETKKQIVTFSDKMKQFDIQIKSFLKRKMYFHHKVYSKTNLGRKIITKLTEKKTKKYINTKVRWKFRTYDILE